MERMVMKCNTSLAKAKKRLRGTHVRAHVKKVQLAEAQFQQDPTNEKVKDILSESQGRLTNIFQEQVTCNYQFSSTKWFKYGDTCSKTFFDFHLIGKKKMMLKELVIKSGTITGHADLSHFIIDFYAHLYSSDAHVSGTIDAQEECWTSVPARVTEAMNVDMIRDLTLKEIVDAISSLPKGKAPGHDNIPIEFFQEYTEEVAPTLLKAFTAMLNLGKTSAHINKGPITIIPKSGDHSKFGNWRPITLLGIIYKILVKVLAGRIQASLPLIIKPNQTRFVEGRSILDNIFLVQESLD
jgi:hypothetical protein